jgi:hypothetical protein
LEALDAGDAGPYVVDVPKDIADKARLSIERMITIS